MIDVEFATLGIIRCNIADSVKCKIAFERVEGNRKLFDSSWCFMASCWSFSPFWISDHSYKNKDLLLICVMQCVNSVLLYYLCLLFWLPVFFFFYPLSLLPALNVIPLTHRESLADVHVSIKLWLSYEIYKSCSQTMTNWHRFLLFETWLYSDFCVSDMTSY